MLLQLSNSASAKMQNSDGTGFGNHAIEMQKKKKIKQLQDPFTEETEGNNVGITSLKDDFTYKSLKQVTFKNPIYHNLIRKGH